MALETGCVVVCRPNRKKPRELDGRRLKSMVRSVCRRHGHLVASLAVHEALAECENEEGLICGFVHSLIEDLGEMRVELERDWKLMLIEEFYEWWDEFRKSSVGKKLKVPKFPDPLGLLATARKLRDGDYEEKLRGVATRLGCTGYTTGGRV